MSNLYEDIFEYLESANNSRSVNLKGLDELVYKVHASTDLSKEASAIVVKLFFQEIRNIMLRGECVVLRDVGKFYISSPKCSGNKKQIFPKFKPYQKLITRINNGF